MKERKGTTLMLIGLLLIVAALLLMIANTREEQAAENASADAAAQIMSFRDQQRMEAMLKAQQSALATTEGPVASVVEEAASPAPAGASPDEMLPSATPGAQADLRDLPVLFVEPADSPAPATPVPPDCVLFPEMDMPTIDIDGHAYVGTLEIPALQLSLPVMNEWSYPNLKLSPCRYSGTAYLNNLVIIAHNYERHFGRIKLLMPGDELRFIDMAGNTFRYVVAETEILQPYQSKELVESDYALTLLTCTIGGRTRVTVRCNAAEG